MPSLLKIYLRPKRGELHDVPQAQATVGSGLVGDHAKGPKRQITLLSKGAWEAACAELGKELDPGTRRANLYVGGLDLAKTTGRTIRIGAVRVALTGETKPCPQMEEAVPGLQEALTPNWRGGVFGEVLDDGQIAVGDPVAFVD